MSPTAAYPAPAQAPAPESGQGYAPESGQAPGQTPGPAWSQTPRPAAAPLTEGRALGLSSLVLGLVSIFAGWTFFAPVAGLVTGIMALSREPANRTMAIWGIVLNSVMIAGWVLIGLLIVGLGLALAPFAFVL
ncbi:hypothetical protein GCM10022381_40310 [Leifsonia kafniensis]|uniref:DUF4190 domain-containing protein n=1 Tax=Leifsonia kafniensis TaxID=475957 RepID=A0ABP7L474_9MICO